MWLHQAVALLFALAAGAAGAVTLRPVEMGELWYAEGHINGEHFSHEVMFQGGQSASIGWTMHTDKTTGAMIQYEAGYAVFQLPEFDRSLSGRMSVGNVALTATVSAGSAIDVWDLVGPPGRALSYLGRRSFFGTLYSDSHGHGSRTVSSYLSGRIVSHLLESSGGLLYMGFFMDIEGSREIRDISLTMTPPAFLSPLPPGFLLFGSGVLGLLGFGALRKKVP